MKYFKINSNSTGLTMAELLVTTGIISLLAAIAIPNLLKSKTISNEANAQATLKTISNALEIYYSNNNMYPSAISDLTSSNPSYLSQDFFSGSIQGYTYAVGTLSNFNYAITASPLSSSTGTESYTISTGGIIVENP